jgi:hypothetical protein
VLALFLLHTSANRCRSNVPVAFHTSLTTASFTLHHAVLHYRPILGRPSPCIPPTFTLDSRTVHSAALYTLPPFALHSAVLYPSHPHSSPPSFIAPPFTLRSATLYPSLSNHHYRPSLRRASPFIPPLFTIHSRTLHSRTFHFRPSLCRSSPVIPTLFTPHSPTLHSDPPLRLPSPCIPPLFNNHSRTLHSRPSFHCTAPFIPPPCTLHSATLHSHHSFHRTDDLHLLSSSSSDRARTATPGLPLELQLPSLKLKILPLAVKWQPATIFYSTRTPTDLLPIPLHIFDTRQATARPTAHGATTPNRHVVQERHPQVPLIVTDLLPIP